MKKFKVTWKRVAYYQTFIEAKDLDEAYDKFNDMDSDDGMEYEGYTDEVDIVPEDKYDE